VPACMLPRHAWQGACWDGDRLDWGATKGSPLVPALNPHTYRPTCPSTRNSPNAYAAATPIACVRSHPAASLQLDSSLGAARCACESPTSAASAELGSLPDVRFGCCARWATTMMTTRRRGPARAPAPAGRGQRAPGAPAPARRLRARAGLLPSTSRSSCGTRCARHAVHCPTHSYNFVLGIVCFGPRSPFTFFLFCGGCFSRVEHLPQLVWDQVSSHATSPFDSLYLIWAGVVS
jgi:hypothetical protein